VRALVAETTLTPADLIWPVFVVEDAADAGPVGTLPGVRRLTVAELLPLARHAASLGIPALHLFAVMPARLKSPDGREVLRPDTLICRAARELKAAVPEIGLIADVALDQYTDHGHDGVFDGLDVVNDATVAILAEAAVTHAQAGIDVIAPSEMMDGRVGAIRQALEAGGHHQTLILSYAVKYASRIYEPFRDALGSRGNLARKEKRTYQMNPANVLEALREVELDLAEGADMVIVKPGQPFLDVVHRVKATFGVPTVAYQVSGEYAMIEAVRGAMDADALMDEALLGCKRAGADAILTYAAVQVAERLNG
jgi:porphobilinogen synthase